MTDDKSQSEPKRISVQASVNLGSFSASATLKVIPVDGVEVEDSSTPKFLRLATGDFSCYKSVFLVHEGKRYEITVDTLPE